MSSFLPPAPVLHPLTPPTPHASALLDISSGTAFCSRTPAPSLPSENRGRMLGYKGETHRGPGVQSMGKDTGPEVPWGPPSKGGVRLIVCEGLGGGWAKEEWFPDRRTERPEVRAPPVSGKVVSVKHLEGVWAGDLPSLMPVCPPLSSPPLSPAPLPPLRLSLDSVSLGATLSICVCHLGLLPPSLALISSCFLGCLSLCTSLYWHSVPFSCLHGSLWVTSTFISGPWLPSRSSTFSPYPCRSLLVISDAGLCPAIPASISVLGPATVPLPSHRGPSSCPSE